jgi:hypothetical protein
MRLAKGAAFVKLGRDYQDRANDRAAAKAEEQARVRLYEP